MAKWLDGCKTLITRAPTEFSDGPHGQSYFCKEAHSSQRAPGRYQRRPYEPDSYLKKVETAIASGDADAAREALRVAQPEIQRGVSRGVLHRNTISRKLALLPA